MFKLQPELLQKCRICLTKGEVTYPLFLRSHEDKSISDLIHNLTHIQIPQLAGLSENICGKCKTIVIEFHTLILMFKKNTEYLQNILRRTKPTSKDIDHRDVIEKHSEKNHVSDIVPLKDLSREGHTFLEIEHQCSTSNVEDIKVENDNNFFLENDRDSHFKDDLNNPNEVFGEDYESNSIKKYKCKYCKESYNDELSLKEHSEIHRTFICDQCGAAFFRKAYLLDHKFTHTSEKRFSCEKCGKRFKYRSGLRVHETIHINYRGFICDICAASFNTKTTLNTHILLKHKIERKFKCTECNLSFKLNSWLRKHFMRKHSGNRTKNFVCTICGVSYLNKTTLTRHIEEKHSGPQRRYPCTACDKTYASTTKLNLHMKKIHCFDQ